MFQWLGIFIGAVCSALQTQRALAIENLTLRQQLVVLKRRCPRPRLTEADRLFWVVAARIWPRWRECLQIVQPDTVVRWYRQGFRYYWRWKSRRRGRPKIDPEIRDLIRRMCRANPLWGAPRIHGELLKLGIAISEATVSKYMVRRAEPPSQSWRTFLENHAKELIALDFFTVPSATFRVLFVLIVLSHDRRRIVHFNVTEHPTAEWTARQLLETCAVDETPAYVLRDRDGVYGQAFQRQAHVLGIEQVVMARRSPWQNPYAGRVIGSIQRECLDHAVVLGERHLRRIVARYADYYNRTRTHLSLAKDSPDGRAPQLPEQGRIVELPRVGGLHHEYLRMAA